MHFKTKTCPHISSRHVMFGLSPVPSDYDNNRGTKTKFACINMNVRPSLCTEQEITFYSRCHYGVCSDHKKVVLPEATRTNPSVVISNMFFTNTDPFHQASGLTYKLKV